MIVTIILMIIMIIVIISVYSLYTGLCLKHKITQSLYKQNIAGQYPLFNCELSSSRLQFCIVCQLPTVDGGYALASKYYFK